MNKISAFFLWCFILCSFNAQAAIRVVVLGSSTAKGIGASNGNSWVSKYHSYLKTLDSKNEVINLADSGSNLNNVPYTSYHIMPTGSYIAGKPLPDVNRNITRALSFAPDIIIINMPTNDAYSTYTVAETMANFSAVIKLANSKKIPVYITTSQPRNFTTTPEKIQLLISLKSKLFDTYGKKVIDFWTTLADGDGSINSNYDSGDGIHFNNAGHDLLYGRVKNVVAIDKYFRSKN